MAQHQMKLEQAARQALVALEDVMADFDGSWALADTAITALREALAEQAEQEPVAWYSVKGGFNTCGEGKPLYAAPVRTKDYNPDVTFNDDGTFSLTLPDGDELRIISPQQEPTAEVSEDGYAWGKDGILPAGTKLYAAPVQPIDLTEDEELELARSSAGKSRQWLVAAAIALYKDKNK